MSAMSINWFEIPVTDLDRAATFYGAVFQQTLASMEGPGSMRVFMNGEVPFGAVSISAENAASSTGVRIFLDAQGDLDGMLARVEKAGGTVALPKTSIGQYGFIAHIVDLDGNTVGLHSV